MSKLTPKHQRWLKIIHVLFACGWVGTGICLTTANFALVGDLGAARYGIDVAMKFLDDFVLVPSALGCLLTGILYATLTNWGWFRHRWITVKWIITLGGIIFGTFWLGPWINTLPPISSEHAGMASGMAAYGTAVANLQIWGTAQVATLIFALGISILKPWKRQR